MGLILNSEFNNDDLGKVLIVANSDDVVNFKRYSDCLFGVDNVDKNMIHYATISDKEISLKNLPKVPENFYPLKNSSFYKEDLLGFLLMRSSSFNKIIFSGLEECCIDFIDSAMDAVKDIQDRSYVLSSNPFAKHISKEIFWLPVIEIRDYEVEIN